ncbi:hypothetical protein [[Mycoplasma] mobile]|uniref:Expressed protein n=1 Tax=Mycoplasma mobile (strain ATCC 43663 / 163K / NCTC 11711) TaxID=267748 RepID=Q6KHN0_MYCM1|nr:hypothetical protein [[Mycoplasma] mobile]AAT27900.1 expressed protein [Mycoplasma mobile 163K]
MDYPKIISKLAKTIASVPGFQNFASLFDDKREINYLEVEHLPNAFIINEGAKGLRLKMGVILLLNARTKIIVNQIREEIINTLKNENLKLESLDIFVQGVK